MMTKSGLVGARPCLEPSITWPVFHFSLIFQRRSDPTMGLVFHSSLIFQRYKSDPTIRRREGGEGVSLNEE